MGVINAASNGTFLAHLTLTVVRKIWAGQFRDLLSRHL